jgi:nucleotide-binding universal stress UspA family protein
MKGGSMNARKANNRNILIAVDESENAGRAVTYVRDLLAGISGYHITLITIIPQPSEDYFISESERTEWLKDKNASARSILEANRKLLIDAGFRDEDVKEVLVIKECTSIAECILAEQEKLACGTVVVGRRGISKREEFFFGSTSSKILHIARDCAVWVIQ